MAGLVSHFLRARLDGGASYVFPLATIMWSTNGIFVMGQKRAYCMSPLSPSSASPALSRGTGGEVAEVFARGAGDSTMLAWEVRGKGGAEMEKEWSKGGARV